MWDVIVIGGGLAGLVSALAAQSRGKNVLLVSQGAGSLSYAPGVFDFGDVTGLSWKDKHPYALLGADRVKQAAQFFRTVLPGLVGAPDEEHVVLTPLGEPRLSSLVQQSMRAEGLAKADTIILLQLEGLRDLFPDVILANLRLHFPQAEVQRRVIRPERFGDWFRQGKSLTALDYGRFWQSPEGRALLQSLEVPQAGSTVYLIPGWLEEDLRDSNRTADHELDRIQRVGMPTFPPSAQGTLIYQRLIQAFKRAGGEVAASSASAAAVEDGRCQGLLLQGTGKATPIRAHAYVLATGGLLGGGITVEPLNAVESANTQEAWKAAGSAAILRSADAEKSVEAVGPVKAKEAVWGLPLYLPGTEHWTEPGFFAEQAYTRLGVEVDATLRPLDPLTGKVLLENVFIAGRMLAHWDPWTEHCGGGVSITSGYVAGIQG